jgi:hypothetical protein
MEYVDVTPTWRGILPLLVELATNANTQEARDTAWKELRRMAEIADRMVALETDMQAVKETKRLTTDQMFAESERIPTHRECLYEDD